MSGKLVLFLLLGLCLLAGSAFGAVVETTGLDTYAQINPPGIIYEDPPIGTIHKDDTLKEWRDADFQNPGYTDWTASNPGATDGNANEVWLRNIGDQIQTVTTVPSTAVAVHLVGDGNDGRAEVYVDDVLRARLDMYKASGVDHAYVRTANLPYATHTIVVKAIGDSQIGGLGHDVATNGATALSPGNTPPIPGLTGWGILLFVALILTIGAYYIWRRRRLVAV